MPALVGVVPSVLPVATRLKLRVLSMAFLGLVGLVVYGPALHFDFLSWDDPVNLEEDAWVRGAGGSAPSLQTLGQSYRGMWIPVTRTGWKVQDALARRLHESRQRSSEMPAFAGRDPMAFQAVSLLGHLVNGLLLLALLWQVLKTLQWESLAGMGAALVGALIFVVHPSQVEVVVWASAQKDLWAFTGCGLFMLLWHPVAVGEIALKWWRVGVLLLVACLAWMSKSSAVVLLPLMLAWIWWWHVLRGQSWQECLAHVRRLLDGKIAVLLIGLGLGTLAVMAIQVQLQGVLAGVERPPTGPVVAAFHYSAYLKHGCWPISVGVLYPVDASKLPELLGMGPALLWALFLVVLGILARKSRCAAFLWWGACLFCVLLAPVAGWVPFTYQEIATLASRYLYLPSLVCIAVLLGLWWGFCSWKEKKEEKKKKNEEWKHLLWAKRGSWVGLLGLSAFLGLLIFVGVCVVQSKRLLPHWKDSELLYTQMLQEVPDHLYARSNLGAHLLELGKREEAQRQFELGREAHAHDVVSRFHLGRLAEEAQRVSEAEGLYREAFTSELPAWESLLAWMRLKQGQEDWYALQVVLSEQSGRGVWQASQQLVLSRSHVQALMHLRRWSEALAVSRHCYESSAMEEDLLRWALVTEQLLQSSEPGDKGAADGARNQAEIRSVLRGKSIRLPQLRALREAWGRGAGE